MQKINFTKRLDLLALFYALITLGLYHSAFWGYVLDKIDTSTGSGIMLIVSLVVLLLAMNALFAYLVLYLLGKVGKYFLALLLMINSGAIYFIEVYGVMLDKTMIGNVFNTNYGEATSFFSWEFVYYLSVFGLIPSIILIRWTYVKESLKLFLLKLLISLMLLGGFAFANSSSWLWVDKHVPILGSLAMPWSYLVNTCRYWSDVYKQNQEEELLPNATIKNKEKAVVVLVIGESARSQNFSLYGYEQQTNPLLSKLEGIQHYKAQSCATYTTAGVKCILDYKDTGHYYEPLTNYLFRNGVAVFWRTTNNGEPKIKANSYKGREELKALAEQDSLNYDYDEVLLAGIKDEVLKANQDKVFIVLHTSTSHGPTYASKYPKQFEHFAPVCTSVELSKCSQQELINAYDNTIVYTDYILAQLIASLKELKDYKSSVIFVSDHGESLGEANLYMHGVPKKFAPKEQYDIPFIAWSSANSERAFKKLEEVSQHNVFHSVLDFLAVDSPIYDEHLSIFQSNR